jgi:uncharacterized membrane protein
MQLVPTAVRLLLAAGVGLAATPAAADLRVCNRTDHLLNVALGSPADEGFKTEGWWAIAADTCQRVVRGALASRYVYLYAADLDGRAAVDGTVTMCVERRGFEIFGTTECWRRGYEEAGFAEIDTRDFDGWTVFLEPAGAVRGEP